MVGPYFFNPALTNLRIPQCDRINMRSYKLRITIAICQMPNSEWDAEVSDTTTVQSGEER